MMLAKYSWPHASLAACLLVASGCSESGKDADSAKGASAFQIEQSKWMPQETVLHVRGKGEKNATVTVTNAAKPDKALGSVVVNDKKKWELRISGLSVPPCKVRVSQSGGASAEDEVAKVPANCDK